METIEYSLPALMSRAERYCASAEHCLADVTLKLRQWGCHQEDVQQVLDHLAKTGFVDENRYARAYVHDQVAYQGWGRNKIKAALFAKFIDDSVIDSALSTIDEEAYLKALKKAAAQKKGATREQLLRFLCQRGFTYDDFRCIHSSKN